ncbi:nuclear transport factor 2 family protein [Micromonospora sp. DT227]|uniref:nuclear transport factor 2 family protein n=1 Tax=Micromonospora sp. DT227 TaxID=3393433 RepID=UPI003CEAAA53
MTDHGRAVARRMYAAFNSRDYDAVPGIFAADFRSHPLGTTGPEHVAPAWRRFHEAVPDVRVVVEDMVVEGDRVAVRTSVHGVPGQPPSTMLEFLRVRDGRIAELWGLSALHREH